MPYVVPDAVREPLYAIVPYFNPWRWKSREKHTLRAVKHFMDAGAVVVLVEAAFNRREFTWKGNPLHGVPPWNPPIRLSEMPHDFTFQDSGLDGLAANCGIMGSDPRFRHRFIGLRTLDELWLKENLINVGVASLPHDWQQVCWLDSDVQFVRPNWVGECIHKLQHYAFLQMFSHARDIGPDYEMLPEEYPHAAGVSFVSAWQQGHLLSPAQAAEIKADLAAIRGDVKKLRADIRKLDDDLYNYGVPRVFPGLAWACTRKAWEDVGGLIDFAIWGGGDWHMAHALVEKREGMMRKDLHRNYRKMVDQWFYRCHTHIRRNVGTMDGTILHYWHGKKTGRGYNTKHSLLAKVGFDPLRHLKRDYQGLYQLHDDRSTAFVQLRDIMRTIAKERNEDGSEV